MPNIQCSKYSNSYPIANDGKDNYHSYQTCVKVRVYTLKGRITINLAKFRLFLEENCCLSLIVSHLIKFVVTNKSSHNFASENKNLSHPLHFTSYCF